MQVAQRCIWCVICHSKLIILQKIIVRNATQWNKSSRPTCCKRNTRRNISGDGRRGDVTQDIRSHKDVLCNVILFIGGRICVTSSISMMTWCDHCVLVPLWFRFHIELAKCLLFGSRSSYLSPKCVRHNISENTTRDRSIAPHASLVCHLVVACAWHCYIYVFELTVWRQSAHGMI